MRELARRFRIDGGSFGPADPVVVEQFFKNGIRGGEERLMLAVLQDAVDCFQEHVLAQYSCEKKLFQEAEDWILEKNTDWPFSFENICETLQLRPGYLRQGLLRWKEAKRKIGSLEEQHRASCWPPEVSQSQRRRHFDQNSKECIDSHLKRQVQPELALVGSQSADCNSWLNASCPWFFSAR